MKNEKTPSGRLHMINSCTLLRSLSKSGFFIIILIVSSCGNSELKTTGNLHTPNIELPVKEKWHWNSDAKQSESAGYAQVVKVGPTLYISGVPSTDLDSAGVARLYITLGRSLEAYGASFENVVKETLYTTDIDSIKALNSVRKAFYNGDYPAASWVQVDRLYEPSAKIEVDLVAVVIDGLR